MKHLFLIRHGKSSWSDASLDDRDRPLNERGQQQAGVMAQPAARLGAFDGVIYASNANRARETVEGFLDHLPARDLVKRIYYRTALYTFSHKTLRKWIRHCRRDESTLTIIGHNPALEDLAQYLCKKAPQKVPTGAVIHLTLPINHWHELGKHQGRLQQTLLPKEASYPLFQRKAPKPPDLAGKPPHKAIPKALAFQDQRLDLLTPGVMVGADPEFLHEYRISLRRSRALTAAVRSVAGDDPALKKALAALTCQARATSELRDLDVFLQTLEQWQQQPELNAALTKAGVPGFFRQQRHKAWQRLVSHLQGSTYARSRQRWQQFLGEKSFHRALKTLSHANIRQALCRRIEEHNAALAALSTRSPDDDVHELRKMLKKIRYLAELEDTRFEATLATLKHRQKLLGHFQDKHTQIELLSDLPTQPGQRAAIGRLLKPLREEKQHLRAEALLLEPIALPR